MVDCQWSLIFHAFLMGGSTILPCRTPVWLVTCSGQRYMSRGPCVTSRKKSTVSHAPRRGCFTSGIWQTCNRQEMNQSCFKPLKLFPYSKQQHGKPILTGVPFCSGSMPRSLQGPSGAKTILLCSYKCNPSIFCLCPSIVPLSNGLK